MKAIWIALMAITLTSGNFFSQVDKAKLVERYEIDIREEKIYNFEVISLEDKGVINVYAQKGSSRGGRLWTFKKLDVNLKEVNEETIEVSKKFFFQSSYVTKTHFHALFRGRKKDYKVISLELASMQLKEVEGEFPGRVMFEKMKVLGDFAILDTKAKKETFLTLINWRTGRTKIIPVEVDGAKGKRVYFQNFQILEDETELFAFVTARVDKKTNTYVLSMDKRGKKKSFFCLTKKYDKVISDISVSKVANNEYIYTGTYSEKSASVSNGLFIAKSNGKQVDFIESYNFLKLNNFLTYLPARKQKRVERKKKRKAGRGKELKFNYLIACHDIIKKGDKYIMVGEAYYPTYRTEVRAGANGTTTTRQVFDGYRYTHAVVAGFDKEGGLVWDNSFKLYPSYKPYYVKKFISISEADDSKVQMVFAAGKTIHMKSVDNFNGKTLEDKKSEIITTGDSEDKLKRSSAETDYWYGRNFITYGYQKVKNKSGSKKKKRHVYYINKIKY